MVAYDTFNISSYNTDSKLTVLHTNSVTLVTLFSLSISTLFRDIVFIMSLAPFLRLSPLSVTRASLKKVHHRLSIPTQLKICLSPPQLALSNVKPPPLSLLRLSQ